MNNPKESRTPQPTQLMRREDYKTVKHMDKAQMTAYLQRIYRRGYAAGFKAAQEQTAAKVVPPAAAKPEA